MTQVTLIILRHETHGLPKPQRVPDYHPLSMDELESLVTMAFNGDLTTANSVQYRLVQAIPGQVFPHDIKGPVPQKQYQLESIFVAAVKGGDASGLVEKLATILEIPPSP